MTANISGRADAREHERSFSRLIVQAGNEGIRGNHAEEKQMGGTGARMRQFRKNIPSTPPQRFFNPFLSILQQDFR
ncbi:MAG TPA: hypothetical protein VD994_15985 [Prosthecobacter sp.]|nr:hypothetical protein [Prosthecobacter sp.]